MRHTVLLCSLHTDTCPCPYPHRHVLEPVIPAALSRPPSLLSQQYLPLPSPPLSSPPLSPQVRVLRVLLPRADVRGHCWHLRCVRSGGTLRAHQDIGGQRALHLYRRVQLILQWLTNKRGMCCIVLSCPVPSCPVRPHLFLTPSGCEVTYWHRPLVLRTDASFYTLPSIPATPLSSRQAELDRLRHHSQRLQVFGSRPVPSNRWTHLAAAIPSSCHLSYAPHVVYLHYLDITLHCLDVTLHHIDFTPSAIRSRDMGVQRARILPHTARPRAARRVDDAS